jgi:predicted nucleic acid-binding protein
VPGRALLDTSAAAAFLRGDQALADRVASLDEVFTSVVVVGELLYGARHSSNPEANLGRVTSFVSAIVVWRPEVTGAQPHTRFPPAV